MATVEKYNKWVGLLFQGLGLANLYDFKDKERAALNHSLYMFNRTQSMFRWEGLPDTIPQRIVELYLQINGYVGFSEHGGNLYAFRGGLGGEPDVYYMPTIFTVANPALDFSANLKIGEEVEVISNDSLYLGLTTLFNRYASMMAETELSIKIAAINSRVIDLISAQDDRTLKSAEKFLKDMEDGTLGVISSNEFLEGIKAQPYGSSGNTNNITNLIELEQYLKASWYNEIGLNANYNMKRESLNSEESQLNNDALLPLIDNMLECRKKGAEKVNKLFGTEITVELSSSWEDNQQEIELEHNALDDGSGEGAGADDGSGEGDGEGGEE